MNILADYVGHSDLWYSLYSLFEKRLGGTLYFPDGSGYWKDYLSLLPPTIPVKKIEEKDEMKKFWGIECDDYRYENGVGYYFKKMELKDGYHVQRSISFEHFKQIKFDIIVTTYYEHEATFFNLIREHQPKAKFIRQIGNIVEGPRVCKNVLWGMYTPVQDGINFIRYHPEHYEGYRYTDPPQEKIIKSFMNDLRSTSEIKTWEELKILLPEFTFKMYGNEGDDSYLSHVLIPEEMRTSTFVFHAKPHGGGGFIPRQALSCGKPTLMRMKYAKWYDELTTKLWVPGLNCIDFDNQSLEETARIIKEWSIPSNLSVISKTIADKASVDMNFAKEAEDVKDWISTLPEGV